MNISSLNDDGPDTELYSPECVRSVGRTGATEKAKTRLPIVLSAVVTAAFCLCFGRVASAHEKWFKEGPATEWQGVLEAPTLILIIFVVGLTGTAAFAWRFRLRRDIIPGPSALGANDAGRRLFYAWVPAILATHVAAPLLVYGISGKFLSPNNELPGRSIYWLGLLQATVALSLVYGGLTRIGAALLAIGWLAGTIRIGVEPMLENIHYLGFAAFFFFAGRGPYSLDRLLAPRLEPPVHQSAWAIPALRVCLGLSLITVAFTEKLANLRLAQEFLVDYPLNFTAALGIPLSDATFVRCCGAVELLVGLFLLFGLFPRTIILIAWFPFNLTLTIFDWVELIGHLPFYGALAVLLVWTPSIEDQRLLREGLAGAFAEGGERRE
jgi:uncharacterized membrane protein YphA (DoxX/SURF4 family)